MRSLFFLFVLCLRYSTFCSAQVHVEGYYRSNGTYVEPHYRSSPDGNPYNNYSYPGNYNPYTGKVAGGSEEAYLANYYKTYSSYAGSSAYSGSTSLDNYNHNLLNVNYWGVKNKDRVGINNDSGTTTGYIKQSQSDTKTYFIHDTNGTNIGMVCFRNSNYTVFDGYGMKLYTVNLDGTIRRPNDGSMAYFFVTLGLLTGLLIIAL